MSAIERLERPAEDGELLTVPRSQTTRRRRFRNGYYRSGDRQRGCTLPGHRCRVSSVRHFCRPFPTAILSRHSRRVEESFADGKNISSCQRYVSSTESVFRSPDGRVFRPRSDDTAMITMDWFDYFLLAISAIAITLSKNKNNEISAFSTWSRDSERRRGVHLVKMATRSRIPRSCKTAPTHALFEVTKR